MLNVPRPYSAGVFLTYKCANDCRHCLYACSPEWPADWLSVEDGEQVLEQLAQAMHGKYPTPGRIGVNTGVHLSGGEPFLNFELLLQLAEAARRVGVPATFAETSAFWATDDDSTRQKLEALREAGLDGILISANPFILERVPFERTERALRISLEVFPTYNVILYQQFFYEQFTQLGLRGTLSFEEYMEVGGYGLQYVELFAGGQTPYRLAHLYQHFPASAFFGANCVAELVREWHVHVDNYCNFVPGFCAGLSLGDARDLDTVCDGIELEGLPVLRAILTDLEELHRLGLEYGYQELEGYVSKCHLCLDVRKHLVGRGEFSELQPTAFYDALGGREE